MSSILIKNGIMFDGSEEKEGQKDILIKDDKIAQIGDFKNKKADLIIDATGSFVSPGFIDINNDSDHQLTIFEIPHQESLVLQGITTIIGGNCGSSLAPISAGDLRTIKKWADISKINVDWGTVSELLDRLEKLKLGVNFGTLVGHSNVRRGIIGEELRDLTDGEMEQFKYLLEKGMSDGAFGISTGLEYSHSRIAPQLEILEILKIIKKFDGLYSTHLRSQKEGVLAAITEIEDLIENLGEENTPRIEISHFKAYEGLEDEIDLALSLIKKLSEKVDISFDLYPYDLAGAVAYSYLPEWANRGGFARLVKNIENKEIRKRIVSELSNKKIDFSKIIISEVKNSPFYAGKSLVEIGKSMNLIPEDALLEILYFAKGRVMAFEKILSLKGMRELIQNPNSIISTNDAGKLFEPISGVWPHPRAFGTMPKFLKMVAKEDVLSWNEAIRKITSIPAKKIGLKNRGMISEDYFADIVVFDPVKVGSLSNLSDPYRKPDGIEFVILNGELVANKGNLTGNLPGRILRRG